MTNKRVVVIRNVNPHRTMQLRRVRYPHIYVLDPLMAISVEINSDSCYVGIDSEENIVTIDFGEVE